MLLRFGLVVILGAIVAQAQFHRASSHRDFEIDHSPRRDRATDEDQFHVSRIQRIRYGKSFRPHALPLTAEPATNVDDCKYKKEPWQDCDPGTNTQKRRLVLKKVNAACISTKEIERPCKSAAKATGPAAKPKNVSCRYKKGVWSECDAHTGLKTRTDLLKMSKNAENADLLKESCEPSRIMTRKCKATRLGCKYNRAAAWSDCDARTNLRTKVLKLESGSKQNGDCEPERRITKNCRTVEKPRKRQGETSSADEHEEE